MQPKHTILLVEDEREPAEILANYLKMHHYEVLVANDGPTAMNLLEQHARDIHIAVLDIMVPGMDGLEICRAIREHPITGNIPVIFLTARDREQDEIEGLELGADDYISKPAGLKLIKARVDSLLRRQPPQASSWHQYGDLYLDTDASVLYHKTRPVDLTSTEYAIIELLFRNPKRIYNRQQILEYIPGSQREVFDRTVDVHIKNLRLKLGESGTFIKTYRGLGYGINRELLTT